MTAHPPSLQSRLLAECIGTALLVTFGCGAVMVDGLREGALGLLGIAITWASLVAVLVYTLGHVSGTQINPAVTLALWSTGRLPSREVATSPRADRRGYCRERADGLASRSWGWCRDDHTLH